jgi:peptidoglycan hydrolase-like protein with peptidoglycan-binding domain
MKRTIKGAFGIAALLLSANTLVAQQVIIPEGTVIELRMDTSLNSGTSKVSDTFKATVVRSVALDGRIAIPEDSIVNGRVTTVHPAERSSQSGVIGVEFTQLSIRGRAYPIVGTLTSLDAAERKQILDDESRVTGQSSTTRNILFIGGGAGAGAAVGAIAGGKKGAGIGALTGGGLGVLGALLSRGSDAEVPVGSEVAMQLVRPVTVNSAQDTRQTTVNSRVLYTAATMVRGAQTALRERKYYDGVVNGRLDEETRRSIAHYQIDNNQTATGDLDQATVSSLGLVRTGVDSRGATDASVRVRATDINRKAALLLDAFESKLGVRADDIKNAQPSERDLDLLLQVGAFARAATWYEQSSIPAPGTRLGASFDNVSRILLRSATRVQQGLQTAPQDRRFADAWASIQVSLREIKLDEKLPAR